jgi:hypothetical protein
MRFITITLIVHTPDPAAVTPGPATSGLAAVSPVATTG